MSLKPLGSRVLIKIQEAEKKTASGLYIPDTAQEKTQTGDVIAVGDDKDLITVSVGQKVMFDQFSGTKVSIDGAEHLIVQCADILAIVD
jgi:chaperonin GroES